MKQTDIITDNIGNRVGCEGCFYFVEEEGIVGDGTCRINPPQTQGFPRAKFTEWCGEFVHKHNSMLRPFRLYGGPEKEYEPE